MRGGENDCEVGMLFPSFFEGGVSAKPTGWLVWIYTHTTPGLRPTPPLERRGKRRRRRDPLLSRGGENGCAVAMLFPSFFQGGVSAKPTGWLVWIYPHTTPGLRPTPPLERRGRRRRRRDPLLLRGGENGCAVAMLFSSFPKRREKKAVCMKEKKAVCMLPLLPKRKTVFLSKIRQHKENEDSHD
ncbi:MAG TPA: hypothetical protein VFB54_15185 [Burkholderiales bacterium]|nr:hypothetical protein [Burkholderiales bacterium]